MSGYEYKTLALPRLLKGPRARRQSAADFVSGVIESALNDEDGQGWEYLGVQEFSTPDRSGLFGRVEPAEFAVLIFRRPREASAPVKRMMEMRAPSSPAPAAYESPPAPEEPIAPAAAPPRPPIGSGTGSGASPAVVATSPARPFPPRAPAAGGMFKGGRQTPPTSSIPEDPGVSPSAPPAAPRAPRPPAPSAGPRSAPPQIDDDFGKL
ncbi:hypothetical protein [Neomegalonema perideroedes]|uniref:hypothetical protein n=1 Tax=Neomegalonema perideroedes TaxID=217219 RepID=UPI000367164A|nr:hypothetical protein [Neomegalonema perideroedes]